MMLDRGKQRLETVAMLSSVFGTKSAARFGPKNEEDFYLNSDHGGLSKEECLRAIRDSVMTGVDDISSIADIHPAWIVKALENESPKIIGIILRWLPSRHVRYILEHLPKRIKMSLPKLVESFAVPAEILKLIRSGFERKFAVPKASGKAGIASFDDIACLKAEELEVLFKDLGIHELAMAFQNIDHNGVRVLLNRMSIGSARALQQRIKDIRGVDAALLRDSRYTILEVALDQEDVERLLLETGLAAFSKAIKDESIFEHIQLKLEPAVSYLFKRYVDQHCGTNHLFKKRQALIMERLSILSKAGKIETSFIADKAG